ncbi:MAG TPA: hypothetical protein VM186_04360, partial [Planctomycetota bacterium]|nr:hypothetical protein [Planctomycetota bacterium]
RRRLDADVDPADVENVFAGIKRKVVDRACEAIEARHGKDPAGLACEQAWIAVQDFMADDFAAGDRNLAGLADAFEASFGVKVHVFPLSKLSYPQLLNALVERVPPEIKHDVDAETVEGMVLEMIEKALGRTIEQFIDVRYVPELPFGTVSNWLKAQGYTMAREEWDALTVPELRHSVEVQARLEHNEPVDDAIETFVGAAVNAFLDSAMFSGERGYASLAAWASGQFCFNIRESIDADLRKIAEKRKADLRAVLVEEKTDAYTAAAEDPAQAAREMVSEAIDAYLESAGADDLDETRIADWAARAFHLSLSRTTVEERLESGETAVRDYVLDTAAGAYAKRPIDKTAADVVAAVLALCTSADFIEDWDYARLAQYVKRSKLPINFEPYAFRDESRAAIVAYFVDLAKEGYKERAAEEVAPKVVANAASIQIECELAAEGRNFNALAARMNQKFNLGMHPLALSRMDRARLDEFLHEQVRERFARREREIGRGGFTRSIAVLVLHTLDTRWKDHLLAMDHLKAGIGLRGYAGIDPKDAFKKDGFDMFIKMINSSQDSIADMALKVYFNPEESRRVARRRTTGERLVHDSAESFAAGQRAAADSAGKVDAQPAPLRAQKMPGRNDPCPCGKKKPDGTPVKYKNCCMKK